MEYPSKSVEQAVEALAKLPGIGKKTALRLALHLLRQPQEEAEQLGQAVIDLRRNTQQCQTCGNIADEAYCAICKSGRRDHGLICVVGDAQDLMAIERAGQFSGVYHVLGGLISPLEGVGPDDLNLQRLFERARAHETHELILALSASMEGETTSYYISRQLAEADVKLSSIARGIPMGGELEFTDDLTIARALQQRMQYAGGDSADPTAS
jgi:recombination protein RecR